MPYNPQGSYWLGGPNIHRSARRINRPYVAATRDYQPNQFPEDYQPYRMRP
jgi:hypothetical protein